MEEYLFMTETQGVLPAGIRGANNRHGSSAGGESVGAGLARKIQASKERATAPKGEFIRQATAGVRERVKFPVDLERRAISDRLTARLHVAEDLQKDQKRLGYYDRILTSETGKAIIEKYKGNESLTEGELAVAWGIINQELADKEQRLALETRRETQEVWSEKAEEWAPRLRNVPVIGRLIRRLPPRIVEELSYQKIVTPERAQTPRLTTEYLDKIHYETWTEEQIVLDLKDLASLRDNLDARLGRVDRGTTPDFARGTGFTLQDATVDQVRNILQREHGGMSIVEMEARDPITAERIRAEARKRALMHFADQEIAQRLLKEEKPTTPTEAIDAHIARLREVPKPADIDIIRETRDTAVREYQDAERKYTALQAEEQSLDQRERKITRAVNLAQQEMSRDEDRLRQAITRNNGYITLARNELAGLPQPSGNESAEEVALLSHQRQGRLEQIERFEAQRKAAEDQLAELQRRLAEAQEDQREVGNDRTDLQNRMTTAQNELTNAQTAQTTAQNTLDNAQSGTVRPKNERKAQGLERWKKVAAPENYEQIIEVGFAQAYGDRFTRERLADTDLTADGQLAGAERFREYLFGITDPAWFTRDESKELARKMLSDEALARSIIEVLRIDVSDPRYRDQNNQILTDSDLLKKVLPNLKEAPQFYVGEVARFVFHQGLEQSAATGKPFLKTISKAYEKQQPEMRTTTETMLTKDMGNTELRRSGNGLPEAVWTGDLSEFAAVAGNSRLSWLIINPTTRLNFRIACVSSRNRTDALITIQNTEQLLQCFPPRVDPMMPEFVRNNFYDSHGNLRTRERINEEPLPDWIPITVPGDLHRQGLTASDQLLDEMNQTISPEAATKVSVATANEVLRLSPQERLDVVHGFAMPPLQFPSGGDPFIVTFDNAGEFWIRRGNGAPTPLESYLNDVTQVYERTTDPAIRGQWQQFARIVLEAVGREMLRDQQKM